MIFSEEHTGFSLETTPLKSEEQLNNGLWLALVGINETPPHIALFSEGKYYSVSTRKVDCGSPLERVMNTINRKRIPSVFIHFKTIDVRAQTISVSKTIDVRAQNFEPLQHFYEDLQPLGSNENTCLSPIKAFFAGIYSDEFSDVNYVFELLALAEKKGLLKECFSLFGATANSNCITLPKYTMVQIRGRINALSMSATPIK